MLFVGAMLLTQVAPLKSYRFLPAALGRRARRLQRDFALERRRKYPTVRPRLAVPGVSHLGDALPWSCGSRSGRRGRARAGGRGVLGQVLDMLRLGFTQGIDAKSYYVHDLYRLSPADAVEQTMTRVETKNGLNRALQNLREDTPLPREMGDKLAFWRICERTAFPRRPILPASSAAISPRWLRPRPSTAICSSRTARGRGGKGTMNFERVAPFGFRDDDGKIRDLDGGPRILCVRFRRRAISSFSRSSPTTRRSRPSRRSRSSCSAWSPASTGATSRRSRTASCGSCGGSSPTGRAVRMPTGAAPSTWKPARSA